MKFEKSCGAIIYRKQEETEYLLVLNKKPNQPGHWGFPKGHVEAGETEQETALREILEETGLQVRLETDFREVIHYSPAPGIEKDVVYFLATPSTNQIVLQQSEIADFVWCNYEQALGQLSHQASKTLLIKANDVLTTR
ncbi:MAG: NUDIX domain-containing protein [Ruminococcaceae bacterium]|nr:NUDIX domain-containing protein [Oscillospiraceae bacterium]